MWTLLCLNQGWTQRHSCKSVWWLSRSGQPPIKLIELPTVQHTTGQNLWALPRGSKCLEHSWVRKQQACCIVLDNASFVSCRQKWYWISQTSSSNPREERQKQPRNWPVANTRVWLLQMPLHYQKSLEKRYTSRFAESLTVRVVHGWKFWLGLQQVRNSWPWQRAIRTNLRLWRPTKHNACEAICVPSLLLARAAENCEFELSEGTTKEETWLDWEAF